MAQSPGEVEEGPVRTADSSTDATVAAPTTDEIRSQIDQTRAEMSDTIDAIQTRLSPTRAIADVRDSMTDATVGRLKRLAQGTSGSGRGLIETARVNPLPVLGAVAVTAGLTAYLARPPRRSSSSTRKRQALIAYLRDHLSGSDMAIRVVHRLGSTHEGSRG